MLKNKSNKYRNYGPIPLNEYSSDYTGEDISENIPDEQPTKRQGHRQPERKRNSGWARQAKPNGWRSEAAALDEDDF